MNNDIRLLQYETDKAQRELQTTKQELEFNKNVLLKGVNVHTNDVIVDLINNKQKHHTYDELDKIIIGTVLTHDTISLLYDAVCK
jgi:response regulator of citrate/malate metabolism